MSGLIDSNTGLKFGTGLQFQTQIGTAGLNITTTPAAPPGEIVWNANALVWNAIPLSWG